MIAFEMQNKESILRQEGSWIASSFQGNANFITKVLLDIPKCTSVLSNDSKQQAAISCIRLLLLGCIQ